MPQGVLGRTIPVVGVPNQVTTIQIFVDRILGLGGYVSTNTTFRLETFKYVVGHELGHGVHVCHSACRPQSCPDGAAVAPRPPLVICGGGTGPLGDIRDQLFVMQTGIMGALVDPNRNFGMVNRPPSNYHDQSIQQIRVHLNP